MGQAPPGSSYNSSGEGLGLIAGAGDFKGGQIVPSKFTSAPGKISRVGDIVLSIRASIGAKVVADDTYCLGRGVAGIRATQAIDTRYLWHVMSWVEPDLRSKGRGATFLQVNRKDVAGLLLPLPPLDEQRRIAAILGTSLHSIGCRVRACIWIDDFLDNVYNSTLSSGDIPRRPIRSLGEVSTGKTPATSKADYFGGVIPFVAPGDLGGLVSAKRTLTDLGAQESRLVRAGATMVCCIGATIGKVGIVAEQSAFNQQINAIEWGPDMDDLYGYFTMRAQSDVVAARGSSTTMPILAKSKFEELLIPVAPFEVQEGFARVASNVSRVRSNLVAAWEAERQLFASLQSRAFRGEL